MIPPLGHPAATSPLFSSPWWPTARVQHRAFATTWHDGQTWRLQMCTVSHGPAPKEFVHQCKGLLLPPGLHKCLGVCYLHRNYWSFQKNAKIANPLVQVTSALTDLFLVTDKTEGFSHKVLGVVSPRIKSLALNRVYVQPCQQPVSPS